MRNFTSFDNAFHPRWPAIVLLVLFPLWTPEAAPAKKDKSTRKSIGGSIEKPAGADKKKLPPGVTRILSANLVQDGKQGIIWHRCSYGQKAGVGGCTGRALRLSYLAARAHCASQKKGDRKFRLPTLTELKSLIRKKVGGAKGIDEKLFPNNPPGTFWTGTAFRGEGRVRYVLDFHHAVSYPIGTENKALVRCVAGP